MTICVVDGRGGGLGSRMVKRLRGLLRNGHAVVGLRLNQASAEAMARVGTPSIETAPHMIPRQLDGADFVGSLSLLMHGSMLGEVTSVLVQALLESPATTVLLPINTCKVEVVGAERRTLDALIRPSDVLRFCSGRTPEPDPSFFFPYYAQSDHEGLNRPRGDVCETMWTLLRSRDLIGSVVCAGWQLRSMS